MNSKDIAIKVENISKCYRIGSKEEVHENFAGAIFDFIKSPLKNYRKHRSLYKFDDITFDSGFASDSNPSDIIWALRDVSFELRRGEVLGVIGRNGAGKSTLLKILSRITDPTGGRAQICGRVSSLLEVGTGFHPELTGKDNVYLNGTVHGMTKKEVDKKFDEIVAFSGVEKFIDTPVKRYSSGMRIRLAFSVAAHLEPEILVIDEVLAVGDVAFQKKCLNKMENVALEGRTVLFVSHNLSAIQSLCSRGILLEEGRIIADGDAKSTVDAYLLSLEETVERNTLEKREDRIGGDLFRFIQVDFVDPDNLLPLHTIVSGNSLIIAIKYKCGSEMELKGIVVSIAFFNFAGDMLFACNNDAVGKNVSVAPGEGRFYFRIPRLPLKYGRYSYNLLSHSNWHILDQVKPAGYIEVGPGDFYGTGKIPAPGRQAVLVDYEWIDQHAADAISL